VYCVVCCYATPTNSLTLFPAHDSAVPLGLLLINLLKHPVHDKAFLQYRRLGTTKAALRVYDPYFCEGRMVQHLAKLGYESVYNR
jgi:hypothetical protein